MGSCSRYFNSWHCFCAFCLLPQLRLAEERRTFKRRRRFFFLCHSIPCVTPSNPKCPRIAWFASLSLSLSPPLSPVLECAAMTLRAPLKGWGRWLFKNYPFFVSCLDVVVSSQFRRSSSLTLRGAHRCYIEVWYQCPLPWSKKVSRNKSHCRTFSLGKCTRLLIELPSMTWQWWQFFCTKNIRPPFCRRKFTSLKMKWCR